MTLFKLVFLFYSNSFAHGDIKLIECYSNHGRKVLRAEPVKKGEYHFEVYNEAKLKKEYKGVKISLFDSVKDKQVIENIKFSLGKNKVHLKILEIPLRKVRQGSGVLDLPFFKGEAICSAVY